MQKKKLKKKIFYTELKNIKQTLINNDFLITMLMNKLDKLSKILT